MIVALDEFDFIRVIREDGTDLLYFLPSWHDSFIFRRRGLELEVGQIFVLCSILPFYDLIGEFVSPFNNVGPEVRLGNFSKEEISSLLRIYHLTPNHREISDLVQFTGRLTISRAPARPPAWSGHSSSRSNH